MPDFLLPFGPFHMVVLHLPIGALTAIWFLELLLENKGDKHKNQAIGLLHLFLLLSCGLTIALGLSYEEFGDYGNEIEEHTLWGYIFGGCVLVSYVLYWIHRKLGRLGSKFTYTLSLLAATIAMVITGHQGGELIHGKSFLSKPFKEVKRHSVTAPPTTPEATTPSAATPQPRLITTEPQPTKPEIVTATAEAAPASPVETMTEESAMDSMAPMMDAMDGEGMTDTMAVVIPIQAPTTADPRIALFESTQAIFQRNCIKCHGATKQKGDYRLDNKHSVNLAGKSKLPAIVPGNVENSELMYRMRLPRDDDDAMPPEEKDPVSSEDIDIVRQWIEAGAYWPDDAELSSAPRDYVKVGDADTDKLIEQISTTGVKAEYNAWGDESIRIDLGVVEPGQLDHAIKQLSSFSEKLVWIDCSGLKLPQDFYPMLQQFTKLKRLHLDGTDVSDKQLKTLSQLPALSYLNLYNTKISDAGLSALHDSPNLQKVFLSRTQVTDRGIAELKKAKPSLEAIHR